MFSLKVVIFFGFLSALCIAMQSPNLVFSLNNYMHSAYPGRCVIDLEPSLITLKLGQAVNIPNIPCSVLLCIGDGYGALYKCNHTSPPESCRYGDYLDEHAKFPECCGRKVICD